MYFFPVGMLLLWGVVLPPHTIGIPLTTSPKASYIFIGKSDRVQLTSELDMSSTSELFVWFLLPKYPVVTNNNVELGDGVGLVEGLVGEFVGGFVGGLVVSWVKDLVVVWRSKYKNFVWKILN